jgi:hypothetical protein
MLDKNSILVGTDAEVFLFDEIQRKYITAEPYAKGTKGNPVSIGKGCGLELDNVAMEFTCPPVPLLGGADGMIKNVEYCIEHIKQVVPPNTSVVIKASARFPKSELTSKSAQTFGCDPDYNAWNYSCANEVPRSAGSSNLRTASAHIHIGYPNPNEFVNEQIVQAVDLYVTLPLVCIEKDTRRRQLYGKAGAHRAKPYGVECRSMSNIWITSPKLIEWTFGQLEIAISEASSIDLTDSWENIVLAINNCDDKLATTICEKYNIVVPEFAIV